MKIVSVTILTTGHTLYVLLQLTTIRFTTSNFFPSRIRHTLVRTFQRIFPLVDTIFSFTTITRRVLFFMLLPCDGEDQMGDSHNQTPHSVYGGCKGPSYLCTQSNRITSSVILKTLNDESLRKTVMT